MSRAVPTDWDKLVDADETVLDFPREYGVDDDDDRIPLDDASPFPDDSDAPPDAGPPAARVVLTTEEELLALEPPRWLVDGFLPEKSLGVLFGASETFKSFVALDLALRMCAGMSYHGRDSLRAPAIYVAGEGYFGLKKRYAAWMQYHDRTEPVGIHFLGRALDVRRGSADLFGLREAIAAKLGKDVGLVVLDTLNRMLAGNENASDDMSAYIRGCDELREATGAAVLSIHHSGHIEAERSRGHSSLRAALDVEMKCVRDGDRVTVSCTKMKDAPHFRDLDFDMVPVAGSLCQKAVGTADLRMTPNRAKVLKALPTESGLERKRIPDAADVPKGTVRHVLEWGESTGYIRAATAGKYVRTDAGTIALCHGAT